MTHKSRERKREMASVEERATAASAARKDDAGVLERLGRRRVE